MFHKLKLGDCDPGVQLIRIHGRRLKEGLKRCLVGILDTGKGKLAATVSHYQTMPW